MIDISKIYEKEKILNKKFSEKYDYKNPDIFYKQVLELIVELNELAYETKCFKFWKNDEPSSAEITIAEYADCLMITLGLCDLENIDINILPKVETRDKVQEFIYLNYLVSQIKMGDNTDLLLEILSNLLYLSSLLGFSEEELEIFCNLKMNKTLDMISD